MARENSAATFYDRVDDLNKTSPWRDIAFSRRSLAVIAEVLSEIRLRHFSSAPTVRWADVGCGLGRTFLVAQKLGFDYRGIDQSSTHIEYCRERYPQGHFVAQDWDDHEGGYEVISFISSLHHFDVWQKALERAVCNLAPGGVILLDHEPNRLFSKLFRWYSLHVRRVDPEVIGSVEIHWFGRPSILPQQLPEGRTVYHFDYFPGLQHLGLRTTNPMLGRFFESYRRIITQDEGLRWCEVHRAEIA